MDIEMCDVNDVRGLVKRKMHSLLGELLWSGWSLWLSSGRNVVSFQAVGTQSGTQVSIESIIIDYVMG